MNINVLHSPSKYSPSIDLDNFIFGFRYRDVLVKFLTQNVNTRKFENK